MHGHTGDVVADDLALTRMQSGPDVDVELLCDCVTDRACAADRTSGSVERCEESIARVFNLTSVVGVELVSNYAVVRFEYLPPAFIADFGCGFSGSDDVGEEYGRQDTIAPLRVPRSCEESFDLVEDPVGVANPGDVILARKWDINQAA
jgi:hypothetical protein